MPDDRGVAITGVNEICIRIGKRAYHLQATSPEVANEWFESISDWVMFMSSGD